VIKFQPKLSRHGEERLVKISDQNTQGVRRSKSQIEDEPNRFSENKTSWLFSPISSFCDSFYGRAALPGCKQHMKVLVWIFSAQYGPLIKFQKVRRYFPSFVEDSLGLHKISEKFSRNSFSLKFHVRISTEFRTKRDKFQVKRMSIRPRKKSNSFTLKRTFLSALQWEIQNLLPVLWDEYGAKISAKNSIDTVTNIW